MTTDDFYNLILNRIHSVTPATAKDEFTHIRATLRELYLKAEIPSDNFPGDFDRLKTAYALTVYSSYMFAGQAFHQQMPTDAFEEFINVLLTAYAIGRREGYNEHLLESLFAPDLP